MTKRGAHDNADRLISPGAITRGTVASFALVFAASVIAAGTAQWTAWSGEGSLFPFVSYLGIFVGGLAAGRRSRRRGLVHGAAVGALCFVASALFFQGDVAFVHIVSGASIVRFIGWVASGAVGGLLGVNAVDF